MTLVEFAKSAWDWRPTVIAGCIALLAGYAWLVGFRSRRWVAWTAGVLLIGFTLMSPLDELADRYLFSAHMAKHLLLLLVVPALLLSGLTEEAMVRLLRYRRVASIEKVLRRPSIAWVCGIGVMAIWHIPRLFNVALLNEPLHIIEHLSLLVGGTIYWWPILSPIEESRLQPVPDRAAYLFVSCLACTAMGILITFSGSLLYPAYAQPSDTYRILGLIRNEWGIPAQMDQQIGGLLMWVPGCLVYLTATMVMFARWYSDEPSPAMEA
jgi:cytochrome c oxidase assembly factor CtaG